MTMDIIRTTRNMLLQPGNVTAARQLLTEYRLSALHTSLWNPFLLLPHVDIECFPQDHLHGVCVYEMYLHSACKPQHLTFVLRRDLGVTLFVVDAVRAFIQARHVLAKATGDRLLQQLSLRTQRLTASLPGAITVFGAFAVQGPTLQGAHYRYALLCIAEQLSFLIIMVCSAIVRVFDIVVADQHPHIVSLVRALLQWHQLVCKHPRMPEDNDLLLAATRKFYQCLEPFVAVGVSINTPKVHRMFDIPNIIQTFGGSRIVSTDQFEMAHKALKSVYPRCGLL